MNKFCCLSYSRNERLRWVFFSIVCLLFLKLAASRAYADVNWNSTGSSSVGGTGFWEGVTQIYGMVYGVLFVGAAVVLGFGAFKFIKGDAEAVLYYLGGGAFLGVIPFAVQFFRSLGQGGGLGF